jgi:hypothetical protein
MTAVRFASFAALLQQHFPPMSCAFAYGSGVFEQVAANATLASSRPLVDLIFVVDNADEWHRANLRTNASHYAGWLRAVPFAWGVSPLQRNAVFFNPFVQLHGERVKYGVVQRDVVLHDLLHWDRLYVAGRLQKPVRFIGAGDRADAELQRALTANLDAALRVALDDLAATTEAPFADTQLFERIAGLSYAGDVRMRFAENPHKVGNIVRGSVDRFRRLYGPRLECYAAERRFGTLHTRGDGTMQVRVDAAQRAAFAAALPAAVVRHGSLARIVAQSSREQTLRSALTSGLLKSARYLGAKVSKRFLA